MKTRMATGRCCCAEFCDDGESSRTDNFSSYSAGENLTPYGYIGSGANPVEDSGGIRVVKAVLDSGQVARRVFPFQWESQSQVSFEVVLKTNHGQMGFFEVDFFSGFTPGMRWLSNTDIRLAHTTSTGTPTTTTISRAYAIDDVFKVVYRKISFTYPSASEVRIVGEADYYHDGVLFSTQHYVKQQLKTWWCTRSYGTAIEGCITDDWDFQIT